MAISSVMLSYVKAGRTAHGVDQSNFPTVVNSSSPETTTSQSFTAATFAAVSIPTGAKGVIVVPPSDNAGAITQKGITGDTGNALGVITAPYYLPITAASSLGFLCANTTVLEFIWV